MLIRSVFNTALGLVCAVVDELGLNFEHELRPNIAQVIETAVNTLKCKSREVLLSKKDKGSRCGVCSVQDPERLQQILATVSPTRWNSITMWLE